MRLGQALDYILNAVPVPKSAQIRELAKTCLHQARLRACAIKPWPWMLRTTARRNSGGYKTGTVAVTQNSRTVTLTGGTWPSVVVGYHFSVNSAEQERYVVASRTSDAIIVLDRPFEGDTESAKQYIVWQPYVQAPCDLSRWKSIRFERGNTSLGYEDQAWFDAYFPFPVSLGTDISMVTHSEPSTAAKQSSSTVTIAAASTSVTLATGSWPEDVVGHHLRFQGEEALYRIASRSSDTLLVLDRAYGGAFPGAGVSYELDPPGAIQIEINPPQEDQFSLKFRYYAEPQILVNLTDPLEGPESFQKALVEIATGSFLMSQLPDPGPQGDSPAYRAMIQIATTRATLGENLLKALVGNTEAPAQFARMRNIRDM